MPDYKITAPDGNSYTVTAPDGATQDQVLQYAQANYQHPAVQSGDGLSHPDQSSLGSGLSGNRAATITDTLGGSPLGLAAQGLNALGAYIDTKTDPGSTAQKITDSVVSNTVGAPTAMMHHAENLPVGLGQGATHLGNFVSGGSLQNATNNIDKFAQNREAQYQAGTPTNVGSIGGAIVGEAAPFIGGAPAKAVQAVGNAAKIIPDAAGAVARIGNQVLSGGAQAATIAAAQPVTSGPEGSQLGSLVSGQPATPSYASQKAEQIGLGGVTGGIPGAAGQIGREVIGSVAPDVQALAQKAANYGIDLTAPQVSKSIPLKIANKTTGQVPFSGATAFADKQQGQFNNAVAQTIGLPQGTTKITPDVFSQAKKVIGQGYDDLAARNNLTINPPLVSRIQSILGEAHTDGDPDAARAISNLTTEIIGKASQNGSALTGAQFQSIDSRLGRLATGQGDKAHYAGELQDALREGMESGMSPADAAKSQELRSQWRNALNLTPILADGTGDIPPSRLLSAVANNKAGKTQLATGTRGDLGTLAQIGKQFLRDPAPDSGTAVRNVAFDTLKGLGAITAGATTGVGIPATAGTLVAARLIQSGLRSRALYNVVAKLPQQQQGPVRDAITAILGQQSAQNINRLNAPTPSANNISRNP